MFTKWTITQDIINSIKEFEEINTILEFGSGDGTDELLKYFNVISIENDKKFLEHTGKKKHKHFHVELNEYSKDSFFYNRQKIEIIMQNEKYDLILLDGPNGKHNGRYHFIKFFNFIKVPVIIDDTHIKEYSIMAKIISKKLNKVCLTYNTVNKKKYSVIK